MGQNFFIALKKIAFKNHTSFDYYYYFHVNATLALTMTNDIIIVGNCYNYYKNLTWQRHPKKKIKTDVKYLKLFFKLCYLRISYTVIVSID